MELYSVKVGPTNIHRQKVIMLQQLCSDRLYLQFGWTMCVQLR